MKILGDTNTFKEWNLDLLWLVNLAYIILDSLIIEYKDEAQIFHIQLFSYSL